MSHRNDKAYEIAPNSPDFKKPPLVKFAFSTTTHLSGYKATNCSQV